MDVAYDQLKQTRDEFWNSVKSVAGVETISVTKDSGGRYAFNVYVEQAHFDSIKLPSEFGGLPVQKKLSEGVAETQSLKDASFTA